jgi:amino acid transporter
MEPVRGQDVNGHEMANYGGMEVHEYNEYRGMEAHTYHGNSSDDGEKRNVHAGGQVYEEDPRQRLRRDLKTRQISMIALGGALGTGLLINTGPYLKDSGPVSMLIGYAMVGLLCFVMMCAMVCLPRIMIVKIQLTITGRNGSLVTITIRVHRIRPTIC